MMLSTPRSGFLGILSQLGQCEDDALRWLWMVAPTIAERVGVPIQTRLMSEEFRMRDSHFTEAILPA
jgi:hypothetical protein